MQLIGMLDSPYVRRTAISLNYLEIEFEHLPLSVFSNFKEFQQINPVVKAPSLAFSNGEVLMDSNLILAFAQAITLHKHRLVPADISAYKQDLCILGFALAACEKTVQIIYEHKIRPPEKHFAPWLSRVAQQLSAACRKLELAVAKSRFGFGRDSATQGGITAAVTWQFIHSMAADIIPAAEFPALVALSETAEQTDEFMAFPAVGPGVLPVS